MPLTLRARVSHGDSGHDFKMTLPSDGDKPTCACPDIAVALVDKELDTVEPDLVALSVCFGALEARLTNKASQKWPSDLQVRTARP